MPTGVYQRTPETMKKVRKSLALGRTKEARIKAVAAIKKTWEEDPAKREEVSRKTREKMHEPVTREKHLKGLAKARKKHGVTISGGNGRIPAPMVALLESVLVPAGFVREHPALTKGHGTGLSCPPSYKIDFAHPKRKIAIEIDGPAHRPLDQRIKDEKKTTILLALGWKLFRMKHE